MAGAIKQEIDKKATRQAYGEALVELGKVNNQVIVLDAETSNSTFADKFKGAYPDRFVECFIAEQNMISVATGLSRTGKIPFASTFAAFLSRSHDQIRMAQYTKTPLVIAGSHAGVSIGADGSSQMAVEDLAMVRSILNSVVFYPFDEVSTHKIVELASKQAGISYIRLTRAATPTVYNSETPFKVGGSHTLKASNSDQVTIMAAGITLDESLKAYEILQDKGINVRIVDMYSVKPIDKEVISKACQDTQAIITVEDHYLEGGLYGAICESGAITKPVHALAVKEMSRSGTPAELMKMMKIDAESIVEKVMEVVG